MTKWQTRQALYLLGLTGILYLFSCKSQDRRKRGTSLAIFLYLWYYMLVSVCKSGRSHYQRRFKRQGEYKPI